MARGLTQTQAANAWGVSQQQVSNLIQKGVIGTMPDGSVDANSLRKWGLERERQQAEKNGGIDGSDTLNLQYQRAREAKARADKLEDELREKRGELIPFDEVHRMQADAYARLKSHVKAMTAKIPTAIGIPRKEQDRVRKILAELERDMLLAVADTEDEEDDA